MKLEYSSRACAVLYNVLKANKISGKVLIPANICETVPATYMKCGIECFFCDINIKDWQIDKKQALAIIEKEKINIVHYNHTYGYISEEDNLFLKQIKENNKEVFIVDDRCLCYPEFVYEGDVADLVLYSTGKLKCVDIGWGGYCFLGDKYKYSTYIIKYNSEDEINAESHFKKCRKNGEHVNSNILCSNWLHIEKSYEGYFDDIKQELKKIKIHKEELNSIYDRYLVGMDKRYCKWRYQILLDNCDECKNRLFDEGLFCSSHYKSLGNGYFTDLKTPVCDYLEKHVLNLFNDSYYTKEQAVKTAEIIKEIGIPIKL